MDYMLAAGAGQIIGRMFDPIGWVVVVSLYFAFKAKMNGFYAAGLASLTTTVL